MEDFNFISAFTGFDILQAEAIAQIVGRVQGKLFTSLLEAGVSERDAHKILHTTLAVVARSITEIARP